MANTTTTPFFIPDDILDKPNHLCQSQSRLIQLPTELLEQIVDNVLVLHYQVVLGLTCKHLGILLRRKNHLALWRGYRDKSGLFRLLVQARKVKPTSLTDRILNMFASSGAPAPNARHQPWMPETYRFCPSCFRHLLHSDAHWQAKRFTDLYNFMTQGDHSMQTCPDCRKNDYAALTNVTTSNEICWARDRGEVTRTLCPGVERRLAKP